MSELLRDPSSNIALGAAYIAHLRSKFSNRSRLYISAYNMGAARVRSKLQEGQAPVVYSTKVLAGYVEFVGELSPIAKQNGTRLAATKTFDL
ncbi:MAG TPA: transglycosylase SLT domain-containing protein [Bdellovibrionales bacterium]|nr:transglycosylase SLT domain-containing protein [Bdellovibrionales bacterium]